MTEPFSGLGAGRASFPPGGRAWETAGARFVDDIEPWENRKLWLLNGAHSILAFAGIPEGSRPSPDAIADPDCRALVEDFWDEAVALPARWHEHVQYRQELLERFAQSAHRAPARADRGGCDHEGPFRFAAVAERTIDPAALPASARS